MRRARKARGLRQRRWLSYRLGQRIVSVKEDRCRAIRPSNMHFAVRLVVGSVLASLTVGTSTAAAHGTTWKDVDGNPSCATLGSGYRELKLEPVAQGRHRLQRRQADRLDRRDRRRASTGQPIRASTPSSSRAVPGAHLPRRDRGQERDAACSAPTNPANGKPYGLSHITFCYDVDASRRHALARPRPVAEPASPSPSPTASRAAGPHADARARADAEPDADPKPDADTVTPRPTPSPSPSSRRRSPSPTRRRPRRPRADARLARARHADPEPDGNRARRRPRRRPARATRRRHAPSPPRRPRRPRRGRPAPRRRGVLGASATTSRVARRAR